MKLAHQSKIQKVATWITEDGYNLTTLPKGNDLIALVAKEYNKELTIAEVGELEALLGE
jgi:hypothetical protein